MSIINIKCGKDFAYIEQNYQIYSMGNNSHGQLLRKTTGTCDDKFVKIDIPYGPLSKIYEGKNNHMTLELTDGNKFNNKEGVSALPGHVYNNSTVDISDDCIISYDIYTGTITSDIKKIRIDHVIEEDSRIIYMDAPLAAYKEIFIIYNRHQIMYASPYSDNTGGLSQTPVSDKGLHTFINLEVAEGSTPFGGRRKIQIGKDFTLYLDKNNVLWGIGRKKSLGVQSRRKGGGDGNYTKLTPIHTSYKFVDIAVYEDYFIALTEEEKVFGCGVNTNNRMGIDDDILRTLTELREGTIIGTCKTMSFIGYHKMLPFSIKWAGKLDMTHRTSVHKTADIKDSDYLLEVYPSTFTKLNASSHISLKLLNGLLATLATDRGLQYIKPISVKPAGSGGFGDGFKVDFEKEKSLFVKIPNSTQDSVLKAFKKEFYILTKLNHPNIIEEKYLIDFSRDVQYLESSALNYKKAGIIGNHPSLMMVTKLYDNTIDLLDKDHWKDPINIIKFLMVISHTLYYIYDKDYVHSDIKDINILYEKIDDVIKYIVIDYNITVETIHTTTPTKYANGSLGGTPGYIPPEARNYKTDKTDVYALGITLLKLITGHDAQTIKSYSDNASIMSIIRRIKLVKNPTDTYDIRPIEMFLKKIIYWMVKDFSQRLNAFDLMNEISDIIFMLPDEMRTEIREYLINNFKSNDCYKKSINNLQLDFFYYPFYSVFYNFSNLEDDKYCSEKIRMLKNNGHGSDLNDIEFKYMICNKLEYEDKITEIFRDPSRGAIDVLYDKEKKLTMENIKATVTREITIYDPSTLSVFNDNLDIYVDSKKKDFGTTDSLSIYTYISDFIYKSFTRNTFVYTDIPKDPAYTAIEASAREVDINEFIRGNLGVCRHRSTLFKYTCDRLGIKCKLIKGNYTRSKIPSSTDGGHAWNIVNIDDINYIWDIMNPQTGNYPQSDNSSGRHIYTVSPETTLLYQASTISDSMILKSSSRIHMPSSGITINY